MSWPTISISRVAKVTTGKTPSKKVAEYFGGDIPFISPSELSDAPYVLEAKQTLTELGAAQIKLVPKNSVLVCCIGSLGKLAIADKELGTNQQINSVTFDESKVFPKFGYYALGRLKPILMTMAPATTVAIVSKSKFEALEIPLPPLEEQKRIAAILDKADAIRRKRQQAIQIADDFLRSVFLDMFGDPVTNPKGWEIKKLGDCLNFLTSGSRGWAKYYSETGSKFIRIMNVGKGKLLLDDIAYVTPPDTKEAERTRVKVGDVLLSITADLGRAAVVNEYLDGSYINQHLALLRPISGVVNSKFLAILLSSASALTQFHAANKSAVKAGLNFTDIRDFRVIVPPIALQTKFEQLCTQAEISFNRSCKAADCDNSLFNSISQKAFAGDL